MKGIKAKTYLLSGTIVLALILILFLALFPKFLIVDQVLQKHGVYIIPKTIKEGIFKIEMDDSVVFFRDSKIGNFKLLRIMFNPLYLSLEMRDLKGFFLVKYYFFEKIYKIQTREMVLFEKFHIEQADLDLKKEIKGNIKIVNLRLSEINLDKIIINFSGKFFEISLQGKDINAKGSGIIDIDNRDILNSKLTGEVIVKNAKIILDGTIGNINFQLKPTYS